MASFRMIWMVLLAAAALNLTNYVFYYYLNVPIYGRFVPVLSSQTVLPLLNNTVKNLTHLFELKSKTEQEYVDEEMTTTILSKPLKILWCPDIPRNLGPILEDFSQRSNLNIENMYRDVLPGGIYKPTKCKARHSAAIIIPYRGKNKLSLNKLLYLLHQFLMRQQMEYQLFVIEQGDTKPFNHGKLLNAGFTEVLRYSDKNNRFKCVILHEPYLIPVDTRNLYRCGHRPRQLAVSVEKSDGYVPLFGGVTALKIDQFIRVNGFSNEYWGNDADLEDMYKRLKYSNLSVERSLDFIGTFTTLKDYDIPTIDKSQLIETLPPLNILDGLTKTSYALISYELENLFTYVNVTLDMDEEIGANMAEVLFWNKFSNTNW